MNEEAHNAPTYCNPPANYMRCEEMSRRFDEMRNEQQEVRKIMTDLLVKVSENTTETRTLNERLTRTELRTDDRLTKIENRVETLDGKLWRMVIVVSTLAAGGAIGAEKLIHLFGG